MELTARQITDWIDCELERHRATRQALLAEGKTYRSRFVAQENGAINALQNVRNTVELPRRNAELQEGMRKFGESLRG